MRNCLLILCVLCNKNLVMNYLIINEKNNNKCFIYWWRFIKSLAVLKCRLLLFIEELRFHKSLATLKCRLLLFIDGLAWFVARDQNLKGASCDKMCHIYHAAVTTNRSLNDPRKWFFIFHLKIDYCRWNKYFWNMK